MCKPVPSQEVRCSMALWKNIVSELIRMLDIAQCYIRVIERLHEFYRITGGYVNVGHESRSYLASTRLDNFG